MPKTPLKDIRCFVLDMDGTVYLGDRPIDGAHELIALFMERGIRFFFFTNNSSRSPEDYVERLNRLGFAGITREHIATSADVTVGYLKEHFPNGDIYLSGTPSLEKQFAEAGIKTVSHDAERADAVVIGFDTTFDYTKANAACRLISGGARFLATNIDKVCPLEGGAYLPDCGSICRMLAHATGVEPTFLGKPSGETVKHILALSGVDAAHTAVVGDRLYTDVATALNGGAVGIAVLSGEITMKDIEESDIDPDYILDSVKDILNAIK